MNEWSRMAPAKINITLDVLGLRPDGFHEVEMIMQTVELADRLSLDPGYRGGELLLTTDHPELTAGTDNLVLRAARALRLESGCNGGAKFHLEKRIPLAAGLAGGSADAAAALHLLNRYWDLNWPLSRLQELGGSLGSDIPFCLLGGTALATGRGEQVRPLPALTQFSLLLVKPDFGVSTPEVYQAFDRQDMTGPVYASRKFLTERGSSPASWFHNDLEPVTCLLYPQVQWLLQEVRNLGGTAVMSGSGPTVMGIFPDEEKLRRAAGELSVRYRDTFITRIRG